ncbi:MAG TPA: site-specific integrase [Gaiellaceae bacterium]|nr:site-specific integrase [Gaiellaceae bacterium]
MLSASFGISLQSRFESPRFLRTRRAASGLLDLKLDGRNGYVFGEGERPFALSTVYVRARAAWRAAGLTPIGLYEARHTCASLMIAVGVNAKAITHYLGHSSIEVTFDRYGHLMRQSCASQHLKRWTSTDSGGLNGERPRSTQTRMGSGFAR